MITTLLTVAAVLTNGLLAGLYFAFFAAVSPAYRRLADEEFVHGFRAINQAILRPSFLLVFAAAPLTGVGAAVAGPVGGGPLGPLVVGAAGAVAAFLITVIVNVPLNTSLERAPIGTAAEQHSARAAFETRWNRWNLMRSLAGMVAVVGLALALALG